MEAERERPLPTTCVCRMTVEYDHEMFGHRVIHDSCPRSTSGPDDPICQPCIEMGHPECSEFNPIIKTARSNPAP